MQPNRIRPNPDSAQSSLTTGQAATGAKQTARIKNILKILTFLLIVAVTVVLAAQTAHIEIMLQILTFLTVAVTVFLAVRRFGLHRESATFLRVLVTTKEISKSGALVLTSLSVKLENLGQTRIDARTKPRDSEGFLYNDRWDQFKHAGTLKIRPIARAQEPLFFDWYSLPPMSMASTISSDVASCGEVTRRVRELEQINYLDDCQDPEKQYAEVHFWLEPKESYEMLVPVWLPVGIYAAKGVFLGKEVSHEEEEYWSHVCIFVVGSDAAQPCAPANASAG